LAENREGNTTKYLNKELKKMKVDAPVDARYTAQDWEGFKELVSASNLQDKDLVLRVISMYVVQFETTIRRSVSADLDSYILVRSLVCVLNKIFPFFLVLRVISMYQDPETREKEIKNISAVYSDLAETILPQLRRSRLTANIEIIGKSDEARSALWLRAILLS